MLRKSRSVFGVFSWKNNGNAQIELKAITLAFFNAQSIYTGIKYV